MLKNLAVKRGMYIGTAVNDRYLNDRRYRKTIINEFNTVTPENEMLFRAIHPLKNKYNFGPTDKVVNFAKRNKMKIRGHPLLWHNAFNVGLPEWINKGKFTREELIEILRSHIRAVMGRYRGKISKWTVVNEAMADDNKLRSDIWLKNIGPEYIEMAFRFAHEADPKAKLYYNDYCIDDLNKKSDAVYKLMKNLLKRGVPIHGIGLQMHLLEQYLPDSRSVEKNIRRFKKLGLKVDITEMDVRIRKPITQKKLENQARIYNEILKAALKTGCKTFVMWGFTDAHSWVPWWFKNYDAALIFDKNYKPKPAYEKLKEALM